MQQRIHCRWADAADFDAVLDLSSQLARHIEEDGPRLTFEDYRASHVGARAPMRLLLAVREGAVVGLAAWTVVHELYSGESGLYISDLVVDQDTRGKGVGRALVEGIKAWAHSEKITKLGWDVWRSNATARTFYDGLGAAVDSEAIPYRLTLEPA